MKPADDRAKGGAGWFARMGLKDALARGGCPLCQALKTSVRRYLFSFLYEGMMSGDVRKQFLECGGFCRLHFWQAKAIEEECWADGFCVAILCENLLDVSVKDLEALAKSRVGLKASLLKIRKATKKQGTGMRVLPGSRCLACKVAKGTEEHYIAVLEELLDDSDFRGRFRESSGLCLHHIQAAAEQWASETAVDLVKDAAENRIRQLLNELREFQRKHDYQFKHEIRGSEWSSPERTIEFLVGPGQTWVALRNFRQLAGRDDRVATASGHEGAFTMAKLAANQLRRARAHQVNSSGGTIWTSCKVIRRLPAIRRRSGITSATFPAFSTNCTMIGSFFPTSTKDVVTIPRPAVNPAKPRTTVPPEHPERSKNLRISRCKGRCSHWSASLR